MSAALDKAFATLRAQAAQKGEQVACIAHGWFVAECRMLTRSIPDVSELERLLKHICATA